MGNTKVDARLDIRSTRFLPVWIQDKLFEQQRSRINAAGVLSLQVEEQRTQAANIRIAISKLQEMIDKAAYIPPPPDPRKKKDIAARKRRANEKRLKDKKWASQKRLQNSASRG